MTTPPYFAALTILRSEHDTMGRMVSERRTLGVGLALGLLMVATYAAAQRGQSGAPPVTAAKMESFGLKVKCADVGMQWAEALKKDAATGQAAAQPRFAYNAELNTCVIRAGVLDVKTGKLYQFLADSLTQEILFELFSGDDPVKQSVFHKAEMRLMGPSESDTVNAR